VWFFTTQKIKLIVNHSISIPVKYKILLRKARRIILFPKADEQIFLEEFSLANDLTVCTSVDCFGSVFI